MKYTFKELLDFIENQLCIRLFTWKVYLLRNFYEEKESFFMPVRYNGRKIALEALELFRNLIINKENQNETT